MGKELEKEMLDLRGTACPINFVKLILKIEDMQKNDAGNSRVLEALIDETYCNDIVKNIKNYNYKIIYANPEGKYFKIGIEI